MNSLYIYTHRHTYTRAGDYLSSKMGRDRLGNWLQPPHRSWLWYDDGLCFHLQRWGLGRQLGLQSANGPFTSWKKMATIIKNKKVKWQVVHVMAGIWSGTCCSNKTSRTNRPHSCSKLHESHNPWDFYETKSCYDATVQVKLLLFHVSPIVFRPLSAAVFRAQPFVPRAAQISYLHTINDLI